MRALAVVALTSVMIASGARAQHEHEHAGGERTAAESVAIHLALRACCGPELAASARLVTGCCTRPGSWAVIHFVFHRRCWKLS